MWAVLAVAAATLAAIAQASDCGVPTGATALSDPMWMGFHNTLVGDIRQEDSGPDVRQDTPAFLVQCLPCLPQSTPTCSRTCSPACVAVRVCRGGQTLFSTATASQSSGVGRSGAAPPLWPPASPACSSSTLGATAASSAAAPVRMHAPLPPEAAFSPPLPGPSLHVTHPTSSCAFSRYALHAALLQAAAPGAFQSMPHPEDGLRRPLVRCRRHERKHVVEDRERGAAAEPRAQGGRHHGRRERPERRVRRLRHLGPGGLLQRSQRHLAAVRLSHSAAFAAQQAAGWMRGFLCMLQPSCMPLPWPVVEAR